MFGPFRLVTSMIPAPPPMSDRFLLRLAVVVVRRATSAVMRDQRRTQLGRVLSDAFPSVLPSLTRSLHITSISAYDDRALFPPPTPAPARLVSFSASPHFGKYLLYLHSATFVPPKFSTLFLHLQLDSLLSYLS